MSVEVVAIERLELIPVQRMTLILLDLRFQPVQCVLDNETRFARPIGRPCFAVLV
jgi:hypothetical protein